MERESNPMQALCRSGCGFYGSPATDGLCSLCYKEALKKKQQLPSTPTSLRDTLRDTATGHTTLGHLASSPVTDLPINAVEEGAATSVVGSSINSTNLTTSSINSPSAADLINNTTAVTITTTTTNTNLAISNDHHHSLSTSQADLDNSCDEKDGDKDAKKKKNRCATCRKKVGLTGFECRCGGLFCAIHRYSDKHDCSFNYREMGAQEIRRNNPVVVGEKIQKI